MFYTRNICVLFVKLRELTQLSITSSLAHQQSRSELYSDAENFIFCPDWDLTWKLNYTKANVSFSIHFSSCLCLLNTTTTRFSHSQFSVRGESWSRLLRIQRKFSFDTGVRASKLDNEGDLMKKGKKENRYSQAMWKLEDVESEGRNFHLFFRTPSKIWDEKIFHKEFSSSRIFIIIIIVVVEDGNHCRY